MKLRCLTAALAACALALAGCGHTTTTTTSQRVAPGPAAGCNPPAGQGHVGVCTPKPVGLGPAATVQGRLIPDVYEGNGCKNWAGARGSIAGGIVKAFEFRADGCLASNWGQLTRLGIWHAAYDFLRPGSCTGEADAYVRAVDGVGGFNSGPPIADAEVPLPAGFVACWVNRVEHDTSSPTTVVYTSPGTWPGGGRPGNAELWEANYGSSPDCVWTCSRVAWQFTDGVRGPEPHCTAVGCGDVSIDTGITGLFAHPVDPRHWAWLPNVVRHFGHDHARERNTVKTWDVHGCTLANHGPKRPVCKSSHRHLVLLEARINSVAHRSANGRRALRRARWGALHYRAQDGHATTLGGANRQLRARTHGRGVVSAW